MKTTGLSLLLVFCLVVNQAATQTDTTNVPFIAYWSKGDTYDFKVTKVKQRRKENEPAKNDSSSYIARFTVVDSTDSSYKVKWSYENHLAGDFGLSPKLLERFEKYRLTEVYYSTSELGEFIGIENWKEISEMMTNMFADVVEVLSEDKKIDKAQLTKVIQPLADAYKSKEGIEQFVFKELQYFHFPFGLKYTRLKPILYEDQMPNFFGGSPIRGEAKLYFESVDYENSYCVMIQEISLNAEDTRKVVNDLLTKMTGKTNDVVNAIQSAVFEVNDNNRYEYYFNPGVPAYIETRRETKIDVGNEKMLQLEVTTIELLD